MFALTPQTEEKYKKIDEEFDKMMQSYRLAVSSGMEGARVHGVALRPAPGGRNPAGQRTRAGPSAPSPARAVGGVRSVCDRDTPAVLSASDLLGARPARTLSNLVLGVSEVGPAPRAGREPVDERQRGVGHRPWQPRAGRVWAQGR